jgi:YVTN family beta-propeller protein
MSGTVSVVDLSVKKSVAEIPVGLHPSDLQRSADGATLYVANANSDSVSVIDTASRKVIETINVRPDASLPFGSVSNSLTLSDDGKTLFVANGGNNAIAVVSLGAKSSVRGFVPAGWYPGAVVSDGKNLYVANIKGVGSRNPRKQESDGWRVNQFLGTVNKVAIPTASELAGYTQRAMSDARVPQSLRAWEKAQSGVESTPVPKHVGEPSVFEHVVCVIKENRTYDQVLGDMPRGNNDPNLCVFGKEIAPNHHALAEQFVLLDNFYCNGVVSADGHAWVTEGNAGDYWEKSFGGFTRIYFQGDPLTVSSSGFIWDNALLHNLSFRNYGEKVFPETEAKFVDIYDDFVHHTGKVKLNFPMSFEVLRPYTCPDYPGWNLRIPDVLRMQAFLKEFAEYEKKGDWPNLVMVYLPQDHTAGVNPNFPAPAAMVADNDLALGQLVEAISHSKFWPTTCIFVIEDDPQAGFDHVDGHRSLCLVASPYTKRQQTVSAFYNQTSVLHTMEQMLGLPPMNQMDAMAPLMSECFTDTADLRPYGALKNNIPLDQMNTPKARLEGAGREFAELSEKQDLDMPDQIDDDAFNRVIWFATKPNEPYPAALAGAHGRGLKSLHLTLDGKDDDD